MENRATSQWANQLLRPDKKQRRLELKGRLMTLVSAWVIILTLFSLLYFIASKGISTFLFDGVPLSQFFSSEWAPTGTPPSFGTLPFIMGSFMVTVLAAVISAPLGVGAAIYMTEIAPSWGKKVLQPVIELLVGIPSVVYGFVGLTVIVPFLRDVTGGPGFSLLAGVLVLSVMILPTITSIAVDTLQSIPRSMREASYALGATRWQTISRVLVRTSLPGLMTGVVLGMARAFGEALAVQMVIGNADNMPTSLIQPINTLTSVITLHMGNTVPGTVYNDALWSMALILLLMTLVFIVLIRWMTRRGEAR